jgi:hypothetical protein
MQELPVQCLSCVHLDKKKGDACKAFPKIPQNILVWGDAHNEPTPTQKNEIVWQLEPGKETEYEDWKSLQDAGSTK